MVTFRGVDIEYVSQADTAHLYPTGPAPQPKHLGPRYYFVTEAAAAAEGWWRALAGEDIDPWGEEHGPATRKALGIKDD